ncbi:MAG: amidase [Acidobacteria bacterium]|nr:amidase [Acidobacteriota bacterium]
MRLSNDARLTITRLASEIRRREVSPVELAESLLERIDGLQASVNAFITVTRKLALVQAKAAETEIVRGNYRGVLHGIPVCLKDLFNVGGIRTTAGSRILRNFRPSGNAPVVDRLFGAGCVLLGKTNMHEFAFGATNINPHYGAVRNPWSLDRISGGSSGGSAAAVAAALALASLGTDTGGSIRIPAAACGCVGLKPSYGLVPLEGVIPLAPSLDHVGPIARSVADAAAMLSVIAGSDYSRRLRGEIRGTRIGIPRQYYFDRLHPEVRQAVLAAVSCLEDLGARVVDVDLGGMAETAELAGEITVAEALAYHWDWLRARAGDYGEDLRTRMRARLGMSAVAYVRYQERRRSYAARLMRALESCDILASPTLPMPSPKIQDTEVRFGRVREDLRLALLRLTRPANLAGLPAISLPCGFAKSGLPIGLQLMGRPYAEDLVLRVAYAYEHATPWHERFPPDPPTG